MRAGCLGVSARLRKEGCLCAEGVDGACHRLRSRPVICSCGRPGVCVRVWGPGGRGAEAAQGRVGAPGGSPGPWVCMMLQLARAESSLGPVCTQKESEAQRGGDVGAPTACAVSAPHCAPGHALSHAWVCQAARAGCAGQRKEHSSRVPCADGPRRRRQLRPRPVARLAWRSRQGRPVLAQVELDVALARRVLERGSAPAAAGALGRGVPGARIRALGRVRHPASPLRTVGDSGEQRWLLWLGGGDLPAGHTARGVGAPGLKAQPNGRQCRGHTPALRTAHPVRPS